jgi:hypothetical protein
LAAHGVADLLADSGGGAEVPARPFLDHALDHRAGEGNAAGLHRLQVDRCEQMRPVMPPAQAICQHLIHGPVPLRRHRPDGCDRVGPFQ